VFAMAFALWAFIQVVRFGRLSDYLLLGVALGIGILSKYLFIVYFLGLIVAALLRPAYRPAILTWRSRIVLGLGLIPLRPPATALAPHAHARVDWMNRRVVASSGAGVVRRLGVLLLLSAEFWLPVAAILTAGLVGVRAAPIVARRQDHTGAGESDLYP